MAEGQPRRFGLKARMSANPTSGLAAIATGIVSAYVANNHVPASDLPLLFQAVHGALAALTAPAFAAAPQVTKPTRSDINRSVTPDALVSFIDGRRYKTLKRHLSSHGMSPVAYRKRYGLPPDYPMVAQAYREHRSRIAKAIGLGLPRER